MMEPSAFDLVDLVDLDRYPIDRLDSPGGQAFVRDCQRDLAERALCALPDFIRPQWLPCMRDEAAVLIPFGHYRQEEYGPYYDGCDDDFPPDHPRYTRVVNSYRVVLTDRIPEDSHLSRLYRWQPLTEFVRQVYSVPTMYRSSCPALSLVYKIAAEGDTDGWHYDDSDGVISLLLQKPDEGGLFEYAPYIRSEEEENYDAVARLFADPETYGVRQTIEPGTFVLFNGKLSMHRVTPVSKTRRPRIIALLSYDGRSNFVEDPAYVDHVRSFPTDADRKLAAAR